MLQAIYKWFWCLLPDKCEVPGCSRQGIRGNENIVNGRVTCDHCHTKMTVMVRRRKWCT